LRLHVSSLCDLSLSPLPPLGYQFGCIHRFKGIIASSLLGVCFSSKFQLNSQRSLVNCLNVFVVRPIAFHHEIISCCICTPFISIPAQETNFFHNL
ncbi:hypothetical protein MTR67_047720, partial [Solanum verrucosum]